MLSKTINNLMLDLKPRQREILSRRFGLANGEKQTLASLGEEYDITRERVRQIEEEALKTVRDELAEKEKTIKEIAEVIAGHLENLGGLRRDDLFVNEIKNLLNDDNLHHWHLRFFSAIYGQPSFYPADFNFHNFWYLDKNNLGLARRFLNRLENLIAERKNELIDGQKFDVYLIRVAKLHDLPELVGLNYLSVSRRFGTNAFGDFGLSDWEEITPKTMRSKAYLVLKKKAEPMHFKKISEAINRSGFGGRLAHHQTVHNELIKDPRFVLIGRGIYGLREHGYKPGFARQVIAELLKEKGPLTSKKIIELVLKQRKLKENTILLNLQNKKYFKKLADGRYNIK